MKKSAWIFIGLILSSAACLEAAEYDLKNMTPEIQQALRNRQNRYDRLQDFKARGEVGENNQGYVSPLAGSPEAPGLAGEENQDRSVIYRAIVEQNGLGSSGMAQVQKAFASVQRQKARPGDKIQNSAGEWITK